MKQCNRCNETKELTEFYKRSKDVHRLECKQCCIARVKVNSLKNVEKKSEYDKEYRSKNAEKIAKYKLAWEKEKYHTDPVFRTLYILRRRLYKAVNGNLKKSSTRELLGCTAEHARFHIESQFTEGMTWKNIHIDHIQPCASFNLKNESEQRRCFHYTNLQPLFAADNIRKSDKIVPQHQVKLL